MWSLRWWVAAFIVVEFGLIIWSLEAANLLWLAGTEHLNLEATQFLTLPRA